MLQKSTYELLTSVYKKLKCLLYLKRPVLAQIIFILHLILLFIMDFFRPLVLFSDRTHSFKF